MHILSQITELNGYLGPTTKPKSFGTKAYHGRFGT